MILDLHIHSKYSFDSILNPEKIIKIAKKRGLNGIAITDHNTINGGLDAKNINKDPDFLVIVGSEINTDAGDIIGLFLNEEITSRNSEDVIDEIKMQDGIVVLPHPYRGHNLSEKIIKKVDVIEGFNARSTKENNKRAIKLAEKYKKPMVAGSDAHFAYEIGFARVYLNTNSFKNIKEFLLSNKSQINGNQSPYYLKNISQIIKSIKNKKIKKIPYQMINLINLYARGNKH